MRNKFLFAHYSRVTISSDWIVSRLIKEGRILKTILSTFCCKMKLTTSKCLKWFGKLWGLWIYKYISFMDPRFHLKNRRINSMKTFSSITTLILEQMEISQLFNKRKPLLLSNRAAVSELPGNQTIELPSHRLFREGWSFFPYSQVQLENHGFQMISGIESSNQLPLIKT